jgi:hypothetical protein
MWVCNYVPTLSVFGVEAAHFVGKWMSFRKRRVTPNLHTGFKLVSRAPSGGFLNVEYAQIDDLIRRVEYRCALMRLTHAEAAQAHANDGSVELKLGDMKLRSETECTALLGTLRALRCLVPFFRNDSASSV